MLSFLVTICSIDRCTMYPCIPIFLCLRKRVARSLILQINCGVKLTQQMRTEDSRYLQLLDRLRQGQCNYDDYELLLTRVVGQLSVGSLQEDPWNKVNFLFLSKSFFLFLMFRQPSLYFEMRYERN